MPLETVHDIMLAAGNAAFEEVRKAALALAERFEAGEYEGMTPADALRMLVVSLPRQEEVDAHRDRQA